MNQRNGARPKMPWWDRRRLAWVNALGFALTLFLGVWMVLAVFNNLLPGADPIKFTISPAFIVVLTLAQLATVGLGAVIVFVFMWRGADFQAHTPRLYVFFWTCAGVLFYLVQMVIFVRFGVVDLPNAAAWAEDIYWGAAPIGLIGFGLMAYVNIEIPGVEDDSYEDYEEDWDEAEPVPDYHPDDEAYDEIVES